MKCRICSSNEAYSFCQPFGPEDKPVFVREGYHYRGFPVIRVCDTCKESIESGKELAITYRNHKMTINESKGKIMENQLLLQGPYGTVSVVRSDTTITFSRSIQNIEINRSELNALIAFLAGDRQYGTTKQEIKGAQAGPEGS